MLKRSACLEVKAFQLRVKTNNEIKIVKKLKSTCEIKK